MAEKRRGLKKILEKLPKGTILSDTEKNQWKIVEVIGEGGFGVIYNVANINTTATTRSRVFAAKVEPVGNGPLFVERNFFMRYLKPKQLESYKKENELSFLGLPEFIGGGTHTSNKTTHRFLIMERFGNNINERLKTPNGLDSSALSVFCSQIIDSLMYLHDNGYAHMDIKPENLLLKYKSKEDRIHLIDFGVIEKCTMDTEFKPDKKKMHNGTLMYSSRDSHLGVGTKRGDLEVLGYNILAWFDFPFPWCNDLKVPTIVHEKKIALMNNLSKTLSGKVPKSVIDYLTFVNELRHNETPNYKFAKSFLCNFENGLKLGAQKKRKNNEIITSSVKQKFGSNEILEPKKREFGSTAVKETRRVRQPKTEKVSANRKKNKIMNN